MAMKKRSADASLSTKLRMDTGMSSAADENSSMTGAPVAIAAIDSRARNQAHLSIETQCVLGSRLSLCPIATGGEERSRVCRATSIPAMRADQEERERGSLVPTNALSSRTSRRKRKSLAGRPPLSVDISPVSSTSPC